MSNVNIKNIHNSPQTKLLKIVGEKGDCLSEHKVSQAAILLVAEGEIVYTEGKRSVVLSQDGTHEIPADTLHEVAVSEAATFYVFLGGSSKMSFSK